MEMGFGSRHLLDRLQKSINDAPDTGSVRAPVDVVSILREFEQATRDELWDSASEIKEFFQDDKNFDGLVSGEYGRNLRFTYHMKSVWEALESWSDTVYAHAHELIKESNPSTDLFEKYQEVEQLCRSRMFNLLQKDRMETNPEMNISIDFNAWINSPYEKHMTDFAFPRPRKVQLTLSQIQYQVLDDMINRYGDTPYGRAQIMRRINPNLLWRNYEYVENTTPPGPNGGVNDGFIGDSHADDFRSSQFD
jgi:hypothetical protein